MATQYGETFATKEEANARAAEVGGTVYLTEDGEYLVEWSPAAGFQHDYGAISELFPAVDYGQNLADIFEQYLTYAPQIAAQQYGLAAEYMPQEQALQLQLAQQYLPQYQVLSERLRTADRLADIQNLIELAPQLQPIREAAEPAALTDIRNVLGQQLMAGLEAGMTLTPEQQAYVSEQARSAELARGLGTGQASANREAVAQALEGLELQERRQAQAAGFLAQQETTAVDPFLAILGRPSTALGTAGTLFQTTVPSPTLTTAGTTPEAYFSTLFPSIEAEQQQQQYNLQLALAATQPDLASGFSGLFQSI
jgi:hypothetical protein